MTTYSAKSAKPQPGRRRMPPRKPSQALVHLALWAGVLSLFITWPAVAWPLRTLAVASGLAYFIQHYRVASWTLDQADQGLKR